MADIVSGGALDSTHSLTNSRGCWLPLGVDPYCVDSLPGQAAEPAGSGHGGDGNPAGRREAGAEGENADADRQPPSEDRL